MYSWKGEVMFRENWEEAFPEERPNESVKMDGGIKEAIVQAEKMLCPKGLPHTGEDNRSEHGHMECWVIGELLSEIERLRNMCRTYLDNEHEHLNEIERLQAKVERLSSPLYPAGMSAIDKVEHLHDQIVRIVKGYND